MAQGTGPNTFKESKGDNIMALTRKYLTSLGLTDAQIEGIIEGHEETVEGLKGQIKKAEDAAAETAALKKELEGYRNGKDWKAEYEGVKKEFDAYKADVAGKEQTAKVKAAYKALLKEEKIDDRLHDMILKGTSLEGMKLNSDGTLEGADALKEAIRKDYASFKVATRDEGAKVGTPPAGGGETRTKAEIMAIKDTTERQKAIAENLDLFQ